jgi:hypothetical protein
MSKPFWLDHTVEKCQSEPLTRAILTERYLQQQRQVRRPDPSFSPGGLFSDNARQVNTGWIVDTLNFVFWLGVMAFPFVFLEVKLGLGALLIVVTHFSNGRKSSRFDLVCFGILIMNVIYLYAPYVMGTYNEQSFEYLFPLHVVFIAFWWFFLRLYGNIEIEKLVKIAIKAGWVSWFYAMALLLSGLGVIPFQIPDVYESVNVNTEIVELASNFVSALLFTSPIITYHYLKSPTPVSLLKLFVFWIGILATGRRSAFFGLILCVLFLALENAESIRRVAFGLLMALIVSAIAILAYSFDVLSVGAMIDERIGSLNFESEVIRTDQANALWEGFLNRPFFGSGLGSNINIIRDEDKIWRYELSYIAALFRFGVIGCFFYLLLYGIPLWRCLLSYKQFSVAQKSIIIAVFSQVLAYAVNPVFDTFDTAWQPLIPILLVATWIGQRQTSGSARSYENLRQRHRSVR